MKTTLTSQDLKNEKLVRLSQILAFFAIIIAGGFMLVANIAETEKGVLEVAETYIFIIVAILAYVWKYVSQKYLTRNRLKGAK
ncbi:MAG: hypothetical protein AAGB32_02550 [Pseudomonadota bacterium]